MSSLPIAARTALLRTDKSVRVLRGFENVLHYMKATVVCYAKMTTKVPIEMEELKQAAYLVSAKHPLLRASIRPLTNMHKESEHHKSVFIFNDPGRYTYACYYDNGRYLQGTSRYAQRCVSYID